MLPNKNDVHFCDIKGSASVLQKKKTVLPAMLFLVNVSGLYMSWIRLQTTEDRQNSEITDRQTFLILCLYMVHLGLEPFSGICLFWDSVSITSTLPSRALIDLKNQWREWLKLWHSSEMFIRFSIIFLVLHISELLF